ncbi:rab11 family-interacting protein 1 isoform X2 [Dromaius novaehollandiae]
MRSNMTASMFDLSMKDKSRSAFGKLKDKLKGKRSSGLSDTASEIVPSPSHSLADSEDESNEKEKKKSKFKTLFSKPGLQKTSLSQSMSVLPTHQPVTEKVRLRPSDFQSQWDDEESETSPTSDKTFRNTLEEKSSSSPVSKFHKIASLDSRQLNQITTSNTKKEGLSLFGGLKSKSDAVSKSSLCINGSHVYMEENTPKDNTPASSPSPHNFRRKQLFASEENLSSKFPKGPEETGRTSPSGILSGSASLETFKSMNLPSYKLLSSEDYTETNVPLTVDITKENKKMDHKKSALFSLVTGKKEAVKSSDVESVPDRTLKEEETKVPEEKSEEETKHLEIPTDLSKGNPSKNSNEEEIFKNKQPLNPFEEDGKPEKAAALAKTAQTKAVKPRLGVSSEEETKATLPILAPDSLPAFLPALHISSDNNPFISKTGQKVKVPDSENITSSSAPLPPSPPSAAELLNSKNPFISKWGKESKALDSESIASFSLSHHLAASVPETSLSVQISSSGNNPFTSKWGQGSQDQDSESSNACASLDLSRPPAPSLHSDCHFNDNNPFVCKLGRELDAPGLKTVAASSPFLLPCEEDCSSVENTGNLKHSLHVASGSSSDLALTSNVNTVSDSLNTLSDSSGLAPRKQWGSPKVQVETSLSKLGDRKSATFLLEELEGITAGTEGLDEQQRAEQHSDFSEMLFTESDGIGKRAGFARKLETECSPSSELPSDSISSTQSEETTVEGDVETGSTNSETSMKDARHLASLSKCDDNLLPGNGAEQLPPAKSKLNEKQEIFSEKRMEERKPMLETEAAPDKNDSLSQVGPTKPTLRVCTLPPREADVGRADSEASSVFVMPKPAPRLSLSLKPCTPVSETDELSGAVLSSDDNVKSASGLPLHNEKPSSAYGCPPRNGSLKTVTPTTDLRGDSSNSHLKYENDDLFDSLANLKSAIPIAGDHGLKLASLPVILEGGSDDELLEDCQEEHNVTADDKNILEAGKQSIDLMPLSEELKEHSDNSSPAESVTLSAQEGGSAPDVCNSSKLPVLPARVHVFNANNKIADLGVGVATSHSSECNSHFERQELKIDIGVEESAECDFLEPSSSCPSVSSSSQPYSSFHSLPSHTESNRAESSKKPTAEGFADKAENSGKKKLLQAWVSPSETYPNQTQQSGETMSPKHRLQPVKPMNATASKSQTKNMNVISAMNEKLLEMSVKKYNPSDPGYAYAQLTHDELIQLVLKQKDTIIKKELQVRELEDYIDNLLVRVMEETPNILRVSTSGNKKAGKI